MRRRWFITVVVALVAFAATGLAASAASARAGSTRVVVSPRPGQRITTNTVRIAVRAGEEWDDLDARLNGVKIGAQFSRANPDLRVLVADASYGLRPGRNVLKVVANNHSRTQVRRATVHFIVRARRPLVGAGETVFTAVDDPTELHGTVLAAKGQSHGGVHWSLVSEPKSSHLRTGPTALTSLRSPGSMTPTFTPDALGAYVVRMTDDSGKAGVVANIASTDGADSSTVIVESVPKAALVPIDTQVDGPSGQPGIQVGNTLYPAPFMHGDGANGSYAANPDNPVNAAETYRAVVQIVAVDRTNLSEVFNRTYGVCGSGVKSYTCTPAKDGSLVPAPLTTELKDLGAGTLVIVSSHGGPGWQGLASNTLGMKLALTHIGLRSDDIPNTFTAGTLSLVGVPGMNPGEATVSFIADGGGRLRGYLNADADKHYGYLPGQRVEFDTLTSDTGCGDTTCTVAQRVGERTVTATFDHGASGYLVAAYDAHNLAPEAHELFLTAGKADVSAGAENMTTFLKKWGAKGSLITIASYRTTPTTVGTTISAQTWSDLAEAVRSAGGTLNGFNNAAANGTDYALVGWGGAGEGNGTQNVGGARLRGALVPNNDSLFRPLDVNASLPVGEPDKAPDAEQLLQLVIREPTSKWWPYNQDSATVSKDTMDKEAAALKWIGTRVPQLGPDPRAAYWLKGWSLDTAAAADKVELLDPPATTDFTKDDFVAAQRQLRRELGWVGTVKQYMGTDLTAPFTEAIKDAFAGTTSVADRLETELTAGKERAEANAQWLELVKSLVSFAGSLEGPFEAFAEKAVQKALEKFVQLAGAALEATAGAAESAQFGYERSFNGDEEIDEDKRLKADELAAELTARAEDNIGALQAMSNAIVSDPTKLEEVGTYGGCLSDPESNGCPAGYEGFGSSSASIADSARLAKLSLERSLYADLVPRSFEVWNTGVTRSPRPDPNFTCSIAADNPFSGAPAAAWSSSFDELDPTGTLSRWRVRIMVHRNGITSGSYSWPSAELLHKMFEPVDPFHADVPTESEPLGTPLGMDPEEVMRATTSHYEPGGVVSCYWRYPTGATEEDGTPLYSGEPPALGPG